MISRKKLSDGTKLLLHYTTILSTHDIIIIAINHNRNTIEMIKIISFQVITALEMLHANLPPTLARSQVSSVRKHLKNQLLTLLKSVSEQHIEKFFINMTTLLTGI